MLRTCRKRFHRGKNGKESHELRAASRHKLRNEKYVIERFFTLQPLSTNHYTKNRQKRTALNQVFRQYGQRLLLFRPPRNSRLISAAFSGKAFVKGSEINPTPRIAPAPARTAPGPPDPPGRTGLSGGCQYPGPPPHCRRRGGSG